MSQHAPSKPKALSSNPKREIERETDRQKGVSGACPALVPFSKSSTGLLAYPLQGGGSSSGSRSSAEFSTAVTLRSSLEGCLAPHFLLEAAQNNTLAFFFSFTINYRKKTYLILVKVSRLRI
jgi:hypothetical protein